MKLSLSAVLNISSQGANKVAADTGKIKTNLDGAAKSAEKISRTAQAGLGRTGSVPKGDGDGLDPRENRGARGAAGSRGAAGRNFSGLAQASGQTSGLVAAYATLAANVFALTAAFKALSDAAKFVQLQKGLELVGAQSGRTLSIVAKNLEEVTGFGISSVEAMKAVASATAAGFTGKDIERIGKVAKGASVALGRDLSDAIDRLTRGTIKLEPELLDELGIMTRLDEATRSYALQHRLAASALTNTQRRQAFLNAVLAEGEQKFGGISEAVDVSPYDKLLASIKKLGTETLAFTNSILSPFVDALIAVPALALLPMMGVLNTVVGKLIPDLGTALKNSSRNFSDFSIRAKQVAKDVSKFTDSNMNKDDLSAAQQNRFNKISNYTPKLKEIAESKSVLDIQRQIKFVRADTLQIEKDLDVRTQGMARTVAADLALNKEIEASLLRQVDSVRREAAFSRASAEAQIARNAALSKAAVMNKLQTDMYRGGGTIGGTLGAFGSAYSGAFKQMGRDINLASKEAEKINAQLGNSKNLMGAINKASFSFAAGMSSVSTIIGITSQGLQAMAGWLFAAVAIISASLYIWSFIEESVTGISKRAKELKEELSKVTENAKKTGVEILKFIEIGQFGKAIDASSNSMAELLAKTREVNEEITKIKDKATFGTKLLGVGEVTTGNINEYGFGGTTSQSAISSDLALKRAGIANELKDQIIATGGLLQPFGESFQKNFLDRMLAAKKAGKDVSEELAVFLGSTEGMIGAFGDFDAASKELGRSLVKLRTPDMFITDYAPVLDQIKAMDNSFAAIQRTFAKMPGADGTGAITAIGNSLSGNFSGVAEIARLANDDSIFDLFYASKDAATNLQTVRDTLGATPEKINAAQEALNRANLALGKMYNSTIAVNAEFENSSQVVGKAQLNVLKLKQTLMGLQSDAAKTQNSIGKMVRDINQLRSTGSSELGTFGAGVEELRVAKETQNIALMTSDIKMKVIAAEQALLDKQLEIENFTQRAYLTEKYSQSGDLAIVERRRKDNNNYIGTETTTQKAIGFYLDAIDAREQAKGLNAEIAEQSASNLGIENNLLSMGVTLAQAKLATYTNAVNVSERFLKNQEKELGFSKEVLAIRKQISEARITGEELAINEGAFQQNRKVSPQETYLLEKKKLETQINFAKQESELALQEHDLKLGNIIQEAYINELRLEVAIAELDALSIKKKFSGKDAEAFKGIKAAADAQLLDAQALTSKAEDHNLTMRNLMVEQNAIIDANGKLQIIALKTPLEQFLFDFKAGFADALRNKNATGDTGLLSLVDSQTAETAKKLGSDPRNAGLSPKTIQQMAIEQELFNQQLYATDEVLASVGSSLANTFEGFIDGSISAKDAFKQFALSILKDIATIYTRMFLLQSLNTLMGASAIPSPGTMIPGASYTAGGAINLAPTGGFANGGIIPLAAGGIMDRAKGVQGIINKPTFLVGEGKYEEAVVPLPNGRSIPVQMSGAGNSSNNVSVTVNMDNSGGSSTKTEGPDMANLGTAIAQAVQKELLAQKAPGGILSPYGAS